MRQFFYNIATDQLKGSRYCLPQALLRILSWMYGALVGLNNFLFDSGLRKSHQLNVPVISVGNLTWGGTGKTPLIIWLVQILKQQQLRVVILTRGYMADSPHGLSESDEAVMMKEILGDVPILTGKNRFQNALEYQKEKKVDVFLLDDGFQHRKLKRDLNIVAVDALNPFGNGALIPRGILREPISKISRADAVVLTKADCAPEVLTRISDMIKRYNPKVSISKSVHQPVSVSSLQGGEPLDLSWIAGKNISAVCSIADPKSFKKILEQLQGKVVKLFSFEDHHRYCQEDVRKIFDDSAGLSAQALMTTHKDAVKLKVFEKKNSQQLKFYYLNIVMSLTEGKDELISRIIHTVRH
jgi:tetraacyldisaccharide 4'-kinase